MGIKHSCYLLDVIAYGHIQGAAFTNPPSTKTKAPITFSTVAVAIATSKEMGASV